MRRRRVLVICLSSDLPTDARVLRQVEFLAAEYEVVLAGFAPAPKLPRGAAFLELSGSGSPSRRLETLGRIALRLVRAHGRAYWFDSRVRRWRNELAGSLPVDAIVVNELYSVPLGLALEAGPVVFDAHEHWTSESASWSKLQRLSMGWSHEWIVDHEVPRTSGLMTVSTGIADDYRDRIGKTPDVVTNAPFRRALAPSEVSNPIRLLHMGVADERRRLEDTIEAVQMLDGRFSLDLVLMRDNSYRRRLEALVAGDQWIRILPPVRQEEMLEFANQYDVGVFLLPARFPNQVHVLPNKLFDYIQARLAVAIGPSREMAEVVRRWDCGVVSDDFRPDSLAEALSKLTLAEVRRMKANANVAAGALNAEANQEVVLGVVAAALR
jgi:hypothetical protein